MKSGNKSKRQTRPHITYKTKDDFLRWLKAQNTHKKQMLEEQAAQDALAISQALMVWADDGGAVD
ncbi:MAG: hypothetical protein DWQ04_20955 [Chloroflexi bacterium]|nr:MAG: hypothetical protein DWQ04_20955 [Chloroflexota bacterium]